MRFFSAISAGELLALDDAELAALDELGDEDVLHGLGAAVVPPLVVRLVLELEHRDAGLRVDFGLRRKPA